MKKFLFDCGTRDLTASFGVFVLRVSFGLMMLLGHGLPKFQNYASILEKWKTPNFFPISFMSPQVSLMATIGAEVVAAAMIILGLATRPAAFILSFTMVVAVFYQHGSDPFAVKELAIAYLVTGVVILLTGAGSWSLDSAIYKEGKRRRW